MAEFLLDVRGLSVEVTNRQGSFTIVEGIDFNLLKGEILGIVGESGCGKSLTALSIAGILQKNVSVTGGDVLFEGNNLLKIKREDMRKIQGRDITMIFQEPMSSLNPLMKVGVQVAESLRLHSDMSNREIRSMTIKTLERVGLPNAEKIYSLYPHQLSGGMRQRVMIASAIICKPKLIIADEPTTALDAMIQAQILSLLRGINQEYGCSIIFISHDLSVIRKFCTKVAVMYAGNFVEESDAEEIFGRPLHEYTRGLINAVPSNQSRGKRLFNISGKIPGMMEERKGCSYAARCAKACEKCFTTKPQYLAFNEQHKVRCEFCMQEMEKTNGENQ